MDQDTLRVLKNQNLSLEAVPSEGQTVFLKSISNLSRGGDQFHVEDIIHPENLSLCRKISVNMRLNIAGIDIMSPDISIPWHQNGAMVLEVNAQPQLGAARTSVYWRVLKNYIRKQPKIVLNITEKAQQDIAPLFDNTLDTIELILHPQSILRNGCPSQYFEECTFDKGISASVRKDVEALLKNVPPCRPSDLI